MTPKDKISDLIAKSGNNFHSQVIKFLRDVGWTALVSPYYNDNMTDKSREIDIVAEKAINIDNYLGRHIGTLNIKLFIECKFINTEVVFWLDEKDKEKARKRVIQDTRIEYPNEGSHHYYDNNKVAKLFCSNPDKSLDNELIYKAINQSLNAMVYYKNSGSILGNERYIKRIINYPLIICNNFDRFFKVELGNTVYSKIDENFQLEINYAYLDRDRNSQVEYFLIDIINFNNGGLEKFFNELELNDFKAVKASIERKEWDK